jgi:hypothetical protein
MSFRGCNFGGAAKHGFLDNAGGNYFDDCFFNGKIVAGSAGNGFSCIFTEAQSPNMDSGADMMTNCRIYGTSGRAINLERASFFGSNIKMDMTGVAAGEGVVLNNCKDVSIYPISILSYPYAFVLQNTLKDVLIGGGYVGNQSINNAGYGFQFITPSLENVVFRDLNFKLNNTLFYSAPPSGFIIKNCRGFQNAYATAFKTENSGAAAITAGQVAVTVTHGLLPTPLIERIKITPIDNLGGRSFWVSAVGETTFVINISSSDTVAHAFVWSHD